MTQVGFVYKLCCIDPEIKEIYIGSTKNLRVRKGQHKYDCNTENNKNNKMKVYQFIRNNGGFDNWDIVQLERFEFNTKYELHARERHFIELLKPSLNKQKPTRTKKEWNQENKEEIKENVKQYYEKNKKEILEYHKNYNKENKEKIKQYNNKKYCENKDEIRDRQRIYREKNREKINEQQKINRAKNKSESSFEN
jgi:hypothetical protein